MGGVPQSVSDGGIWGVLLDFGQFQATFHLDGAHASEHGAALLRTENELF